MAFERIDFSTDSFPGEDRDAFLRDYYARMALRFDLAPIEGAPLALSARSLLLPGIAFSDGAVSATGAERTGAMRSDGQSDILFVMPRQRLLVADREKGDVHVSAGEAMVSALDRPINVVTPDDANSLITIQISRQALAPLVPNIDDLLTGKLAAGLPGLRLLQGYVAALLDIPSMDLEAGRTAARHMIELVALALGPSADARAQAAGGGLRAARRAAAKKAVMSALGSPRLSAHSVAAQLAISPRYLHMLFEDEGYSFTEFVTAQRLDRAVELLAEPSRRIVDIAYEVGFGDISTFNRAFRKRFGLTPTVMRSDGIPARTRIQ